MVRPRKCRRVECQLPARYFKPQGIPLCALEEIELAQDEIEAIRLTDLAGLYQADAAARMGVSRQTLGAIVTRAHAKIARALLEGKALRICTDSTAVAAESGVMPEPASAAARPQEPEGAIPLDGAAPAGMRRAGATQDR